MKKIKNILIILLILSILIIIFFVFHVPDSTESRVKEISKIIEIYDDEEARAKVDEYFNKYSDEEKLEIFANLPFDVLKDNRTWLVSLMNKSLPSWKDDDCFNALYLLTEFELEERRNMHLIKNLDIFEIEKTYYDTNSLIDDIYVFAKEKWDVGSGDFYVLDNTLLVNMAYDGENFVLENFKVEVFEIQNSYKFDISYDGNKLQIKPYLDKFEDNGAFELSEKLEFYEIDRFVDFIDEYNTINSEKYSCVLSDKMIDKPINNSEKEKNAQYLNIIYNRKNIYNLVDISDFRYIGSIRLNFAESDENELKNTDKSKIIKKNKPNANDFILNLFKEM